MEEVSIHCKKCKKSTGLKYVAVGNPLAPVLPNIIMKCRTCKKVSTLKKYTEQTLLEKMDNQFRVFV